MATQKPDKLRFSRYSAGAVVFVIALLAGGGVIYKLSQGPNPAHAARAPTRPTIPVSLAVAAHQDVPVYLTGLGTVQASFTVSIHSQVDGKLQDVLFTEGQHVKKGDVLAKIDPRLYQAALNQAKAKKAQDQATLVGLEKDLERFKTLAKKDYATEQNVDQQQAKVDTTTASLAADDAAIETAQTQLDYTDVVAPSDGRMGVRMVDPGNIVHANDQASIAILMRMQPTNALFTLPAQTLDQVREAQAKGPVEVLAYDANNRRLLSRGTLQTIDNLIDPATATYRLKASFANENEELWPGEFVNARLLVNSLKNAVVVPNAAVQRGPSGLFTWVVKSDDTAEMRPIKVGPVAGDLSVITSGINDGERVVTGGQYKLQVNSPVSVAPPPASEAKNAT